MASRSTVRQNRRIAWNYISLAVAVALYASGPSATADDLFPPSWPRAGASNRSTSAEWDFLTEQNPVNIQPDGTSVPLIVGDVAPAMNAAFPAGAPHPSGSLFGSTTYIPGGAGGSSNGGYLGAPGSGIAFNVPNWFDTEPIKYLRLQITYQGFEPGTRLFGFVGGVPGTSAGVTVAKIRRVPATDPSLPSGYSYYYEDWEIRPNPDWEQVVVDIPADTVLDQVVIDTISTPEPTGAALATAALVGVAIRRRRGARLRD